MPQNTRTIRLTSAQIDLINDVLFNARREVELDYNDEPSDELEEQIALFDSIDEAFSVTI